MTKYIVTSCDGKDDYSFPIPITAASWRHLGYEVIAFLVGNVPPGITVGTLYDLGVRTLFLDADSDYPEHYTSKCIRFFGHQHADNDDILITGDADMLMLSKAYMNQYDPLSDMTFWYANAYDGTQWEPRYPLCHIGARAEVWEQLIPHATVHQFLDEYAEYGEEPNGNFSDELIFKEVLKGWDGYPDRCCMLKREQKNAMGPCGRYDRSYWRSDRTGLIDAHTPRPAYTEKSWPMVRSLIQDFMPEYSQMLEDYREYYCEDRGIHIG